MVEVEELDIIAPAAPQKRFQWFLTTLTRPGKAMHEIGCADHSVWLLPLLLLTALTILSVVVAGPIRQQAMLNAPPELPPNFEYMSPEQQEQFFAAQASAAGNTQVYTFPIIGALTGLWAGWFLLGGVLHLVLTLLGSRTNNTTAFNLAAWGSLPFAIRLIVQIVAMLTTRQLINSPGLSGFLAAETEGGMAFLRILLGMVDLYLIWQVALLWIGAAATSGLTRAKAFSGVMIAIVLLLALASLPNFIIGQFIGMSVSGPMFFF